MLIVVQDANIIIDLEKCGLLGHYFGLAGLSHYTTDLVLSEMPAVISDVVLSSNVQVCGFTPQELFALVAFKTKQPPGLSMVDCSVFQLAIDKQAILLTGDGRLRNCAKAAGVEVHGIIWVLKQIVDAGLISPIHMALILEELMRINRRLPVSECEVTISLWRTAA